ncbi:MAG: hypothetical protein ABJH04_20175 [Cyclobacteriaceae bacterium]
MKGKFFVGLITIFTGEYLWSQNLVPNSSFEEVHQSFCGDFSSTLQFEMSLKDWVLPTSSKPRISDKSVSPSCWNFIGEMDEVQPHSGIRMALLCFFSDSNYRSYVEVPLTLELEKGRTYYTEVWVHSYPDQSKVSNNIGLHFSDSLIRSYRDTTSIITNLPFMGVLSVEPQVNHSEILRTTSKWICLKTSFVAKSNAKYLIIGNFYNDEETDTLPNSDINTNSNSVFYYIDDVYVGLKPKN